MVQRGVDLALALVVAVIALPLCGLVAGVVWLTMGRPVLFRQARAGLHGRLFTIYKFRTMTQRRDPDGRLLPDAERLTAVGRLLRATSLDELPQVWNLLRGDMRLVGPRPLLPEYLERYTPEQARRHEVRPGITGWAQVHGRNALDWDEKFRLDVWYVDHRSLWLDLWIVALTVGKVLRRDGISQAGEATMQPFLGSTVGGGDEQ